MMETRKVVTRDGAGRIAVAEEPVPELKPGSISVEVKASLISPGTELGQMPRLRENPSDGPAQPFGYGNAGIVRETGEGVTEFEPGQEVACMGSGYAQHATVCVVPRNLSVPIPSGVTFEEAAFAHLATTALQGVRRADLKIGSHAAVVGLGIVGNIASQWARISGAHVMGIDRFPMRIEGAEKTGIDLAINGSEEDPVEQTALFTRGHGMDAGICAFGGSGDDVLEMLRNMMKTAPDGHRMGTVVDIGGLSFENLDLGVQFGNMDIRKSSRTGPGYHDKEWESGSGYPPCLVQWNTLRNLEECLRFASEGKLLLKPLITHRLPIDEAPEGCEELIKHPDTTLGVILNP